MATFSLADEVARVQRQQEEMRQFFNEQRRHSAEGFTLGGSRDLPIWLLVITAMTVGAALFGAGMIFMKLLT